ncbi:MAG: TIR domain-containing protein [Bacteroidales bacterium]|nr:TIR domain-containing protein [Bacteroidales bacterium]
MEINKANKYFAFISYKREDEEWAIWLQHEMEHYHLPVSLNGRTDLPSEFRPVFRDIDELKAGNLPEQIYNSLASSSYLVVICSPNSAKSEWVNKEIKDFIKIGKNKGIDNVRNIFPFIVEGHPHAQIESEECFPEALLELQDEEERVGGNVNESGRDKNGDVNEIGRDKAFMKVLAGMLPNVAFDELWNRYEHDKAEEERKKREEFRRFQRMQSRFVAEKAIGIVDDSSLSQLLALEVLPKNINDTNDRPYVVDAERALRQASFHHKITLRGHTLDINDVAFSSDGKMIASIANDFTILIWDIETGVLINKLDCGHPFGLCITFSSDNNCVIAIIGDGVLSSWDVRTGEQVWLYDANELFDTKRISAASSITNSPDGNKLVISTLEGDVFLLDFGKETTSSIELDDSVMSVIYSPNGQYLLATTDKGFVLWDLINDANIHQNVNDDIVDLIDKTQAVFSSDSKRMAFFAKTPVKSQITIWDISSLNQIQTLEWQAEVNEETEEAVGNIVSIAFKNEGSDIISIHDNGIIYIWDIAAKKIKNGDVMSPVTVKEAYFDISGRYTGLCTEDDTIILAETCSAYIKRMNIDKSPLVTASLASDGLQLINSIGSILERAELSIWDVASGVCKNRINAHEDMITSIAYSADGMRFASASADGTVLLWDAKTNSQLHQLKAAEITDGEYAFTYVAFSPDNAVLAAALSNGHIVLWDVVKKHVIQDIQSSGNQIFSVAFSSDGNQLAVGALDRKVKVWDVQTGKMIRKYEGHTNVVTTVILTPDDSLLIAGGYDKQIICWNIGDGKIRWKKEVRDRVNSITCSRDGNYIVTAIADINTPIVVVEALSGETIVTLDGLMSEPIFAKFTPDGKQIITVGKGGAIYWWDFPPLQELIDQTRERFKDRPLTKEEREQYYLE